MREILFRGKRLDSGEWVEGYYKLCGFHVGTIEEDIYPTITPFNQYGYIVDPKTVGQFTGKTDKNGKKVFEHDILQTFTVWAEGTVEKCCVCVVQWWENDQCYVLATKEGCHIDDFGNYARPEYYEVIGNIHDNPELLEGA